MDEMRALDAFRFDSLLRMTGIQTFQQTWPIFEPVLRDLLGSDPTGQDVFELGNKLSMVFRSASGTGARSQSDVSAGGTVWECLVAWYLNFVCFGTDVMAARRNRQNTPEVITDAICVTLHGYSTTTESDIVVYTATSDWGGRRRIRVADIDAVIRERTSDCTVAIVQCKTNWNDNAQIPMLWDLIYRSLPFVQVSTMKLGRNGVSPRSFKGESVKYAFMTVPTNQRTEYRPTNVAVTRVLGLSGGNYWGRPTLPGVATGFAEFLGSNFSGYFRGSIQNHIDDQLALRPDLVERFLTLDFGLEGTSLDTHTPSLQIEFDGVIDNSTGVS